MIVRGSGQPGLLPVDFRRHSELSLEGMAEVERIGEAGHCRDGVQLGIASHEQAGGGFQADLFYVAHRAASEFRLEDRVQAGGGKGCDARQRIDVE